MSAPWWKHTVWPSTSRTPSDALYCRVGDLESPIRIDRIFLEDLQGARAKLVAEEGQISKSGGVNDPAESNGARPECHVREKTMESQFALGSELAYYLGDLKSDELMAWPSGDWVVLHRLIEDGVPARNAVRMRTRVIPFVFDHCVMPRTTLRSKTGWARLSTRQSERAVRVGHIFAQATRAFGDRDRGRRWLQRANTALDSHSPSDLLTNEAGARYIEQLLGQLEHGIAA